MGDTFSKVIAMLLALLLLFMFPILNMFERQEDVARIFILNETTKLVDSVRNLGYLTPRMYGEFVNSLAATNNTYDIQLLHKSKRYDPVYNIPTNPESFQDVFLINFLSYFTHDILNVLFSEAGEDTTVYKFNQGDYFLVTVKNTNKTVATKIQEMLFSAKFPTEKIYVRYGGMIRNEDY